METTFKVIAWMKPRERCAYVPLFIDGPETSSISGADTGSEEAFATVQAAIMLKTPLLEADAVDEIRVWGFKVFHKGETIIIRNHRIANWMREHGVIGMYSEDGKAIMNYKGDLKGEINPEFCLVPSGHTELYSVPLDPPFYVGGKEYRAVAVDVVLPVLELSDPDYAKLGPL